MSTDRLDAEAEVQATIQVSGTVERSADRDGRVVYELYAVTSLNICGVDVAFASLDPDTRQDIADALCNDAECRWEMDNE